MELNNTQGGGGRITAQRLWEVIKCKWTFFFVSDLNLFKAQWWSKLTLSHSSLKSSPWGPIVPRGGLPSATPSVSPKLFNKLLSQERPPSSTPKWGNKKELFLSPGWVVKKGWVVVRVGWWYTAITHWAFCRWGFLNGGFQSGGISGESDIQLRWDLATLRLQTTPLPINRLNVCRRTPLPHNEEKGKWNDWLGGWFQLFGKRARGGGGGKKL